MVLLTTISTIRGVFGGAGRALMGDTAVVAAVLRLVPSKPQIRLVYLGTATYDLAEFREAQTAAYADTGVHVESLDCACSVPLADAVERALDAADVVMVSGGNTLFALGRWERAGVLAPLRRAMERGAVMCGGSAGAICWFDGGHSDSFDPDTFRGPMLAGAVDGGAEAAGGADGGEKKPWEYIRVSGLGWLPGLVCPHHDRTQSNGVPRATDFDAMLARHAGETGVCIDHYAALIVDGGRYRVLAIDGKEGSSPAGVPTVWTKRVVDGAVVATEAAAEGALSELLREATHIEVDAREATARAANPPDDLST